MKQAGLDSSFNNALGKSQTAPLSTSKPMDIKPMNVKPNPNSSGGFGITPAPAQPVQPAKTYAPPTPQDAAPPPSGIQGLLSSPQGFAGLAGALKPITSAVMQHGGLPALMSIYGMLSGNQNWSAPKATAPMRQAPEIPQRREVQASVHLPLPIADTNGGLVMPKSLG